MTSVDGARSVTAASDEHFESECGPCKYDGENKEGINYCINCEEFLCLACTHSHRKFKNSRHHVILPAKDVSKSVIKSEKGHHIVMCTCDQNLETSTYCEDHDEVVCKTCKTIKHRKCKTCFISEKSASFDIAKLDTVEEKMLNLLMQIQTFQNHRNADMQKLDILNEDCRQKIKSFRKEFDSFFDNLEQNMISELEQCTTEKRHVAQRLISTCSTTNQLLESDLELLKAAKASRMKDQMFASTVRLSNRIAECSAVLHDLQEDAEVPVLEFKENSKLMEMRRDIKELGTLNDKHPPCQETSDVNLLDMKISSRREIDIRFPEDKEMPCISGCDFMPNGDLVLCDCNNKSIKLLNNSFELKGNLKAKWPPWDVSAVDSFRCIVTHIGRKELQYIQVSPELKAERVLSTDKGCYGIQVVGNEIFITCSHAEGGQCEVRILDMEGNMKRSVGMATNKDTSFMF